MLLSSVPATAAAAVRSRAEKPKDRGEATSLPLGHDEYIYLDSFLRLKGYVVNEFLFIFNPFHFFFKRGADTWILGHANFFQYATSLH